LTCDSTEDYMGSDEIYITVNGQKVWGPTKMNESSPELKSKTINKEKSFSTRARIDLYDDDAGWGDDDPDHLGRTYAYAAQSADGEQYYTFTGCGARYRMAYLVLP